MKKLLILLLLANFALYRPYNCLAQQSIIDTVMRQERSIVKIKAIQTGFAKSPKASAAIDPRTGRILVSKNVRAGYYEKSGAGLIIHPSGLIVTNLHIIRGANVVAVGLADGTARSAKILHIMPKNDLALIKIDPPYKLTPIEFANSNKLSLGDDVINIGNSDILKNTISGGKITALGKTKSGNVEFINVNINIYKGDSGGPLLDANGRLIGIMAAKVRSKDRHGIAIPSNKIKKLYMDFIK